MKIFSVVNSLKDQAGIIENEDFKNIIMMMKHAMSNEDFSAIPDYTYFLLTLFNGDRKGCPLGVYTRCPSIIVLLSSARDSPI